MEHPYGFIKDGKVYLKGFLDQEERVIGEVKEDEASTIRYFEERFRTVEQKVAQLEKRIGTPLRLYSGYSDSKQDNPLLYFCQHRWRVTPQGELQQLE